MISKSKRRKNIFARKSRKSRKMKGGMFSSQKRPTFSQEAMKIADAARQGVEAAQAAREAAELARVKKSHAEAANEIIEKGWQAWLQRESIGEAMWLPTERDPPPLSEWLRISETYPEVERDPDGSFMRSVNLERAVSDQIQYTLSNATNLKKQRIVLPTGTYDGELMNGLPHGLGKFVSKPDIHGEYYTYIGRFANGKMNGLGYMRNHNLSSQYSGVWKDDKCDGPGVLKTNKKIYKGVFKNDTPFDVTPNGIGTIELKHDDKWNYEGEIENGMFKMGKHEYEILDGWCDYEGEFANNKFEGLGVLKCYEYGEENRDPISMYEGEFKGSKKDGYGMYTYYQNGDNYSGSFVKDKSILAQGQKSFNDGVYTGDLMNEKKHGTGRFRFTNDDVYDGDFRKDKKYGTGKLTKVDGTVYEGVWSGNKMQGSRIERNGERTDDLFPLFSRFGNVEHQINDVTLFRGIRNPEEAPVDDPFQARLSGNETD